MMALFDKDVLERDLGETAAAFKGGEAGFSIAILDVDLFGRFNEDFGDAQGDGVMERLCENAAAAFGELGRTYRYGGDALGMLWPKVEKEQALLRLEEYRIRFKRIFAGTFEGHAAPYALTFSAGVAACPEDGGTARELLLRASEALYRAKVSGRDKICLSREEKMVTKTSHYLQGQLMGLRRLAEREGYSEATLLREALNDVLRKYNA